MRKALFLGLLFSAPALASTVTVGTLHFNGILTTSIAANPCTSPNQTVRAVRLTAGTAPFTLYSLQVLNSLASWEIPMSGTTNLAAKQSTGWVKLYDMKQTPRCFQQVMLYGQGFGDVLVEAQVETVR